jgi:hypothetical protein
MAKLCVGDIPIGAMNWITGAEVSKEKFGLTIDDMVGTLNAQGEYVAPEGNKTFDGKGIVSISTGAFQYSFNAFSNVEKIQFPDLQYVGNNAFQYCFVQNKKQPVAEFSITRIDQSNYVFNYFMDNAKGGFCTFPNLTYVKGSSVFYYMLQGVEMPDLDLIFPKLEHVEGIYTLRYMGISTTWKIGGYRLSALKTIVQLANGSEIFQPSGSSHGMFWLPNVIDIRGICFGTNVRVIHFAKKNQNVIEALPDYTRKFSSAPANVTILFDMITNITINNMTYTRSEQDSIHPDIYTKTYVAWKSADGQIVYTNYTGDVEPDVGTVVYSDNGVTQVGIISSVE